VYQDVENPLHLRFVEEWADISSLKAHFAAPASRSFVKAATEFAAGQPQIFIYDANPISTVK
jgi:quinol monooxygenase YgiN